MLTVRCRYSSRIVQTIMKHSNGFCCWCSHLPPQFQPVSTSGVFRFGAAGVKHLRATAASSRTLEDILVQDDFFSFDDDIFRNIDFGDIESLRSQDENLYTCLTLDWPALDENACEEFDDINAAFLDSVPEDPSLGLVLNFEAEALAALLEGCDLLDGFLLQQEGPLTCDFPSENANDVTATVTGFAQCFPNTESCTAADFNLWISFAFSLAGAECDYGDFSSSDDESVPNEEEESVIEEEPVAEEEEEEEAVDPEPDDAVVLLPPPEENPPEEVTTTVIVVTTDPEPEPEFPFQNLVVGRGNDPRTFNYIQNNIRRPRGGSTLPPLSF